MSNTFLKKSGAFWLFHLGLPLVLGLWLAFVYPHTQLDFKLIEPYYSPELHGFPLRKDAFLENFMHLGLKYSVVVIALITLAIFTLSFFNPRFREFRRKSGWLFTGLVLAPAIVTLLKANSIHACPWSLAMYGGSAPLIELFGALPAGMQAGHCFPAGHASGGFALLAFYFALRDTKPVAAYWALVIALALGFIMGWAQMARGAHFMSHTLWCLWVVWMVLLTLYIIWSPVNQDIHSDVSQEIRKKSKLLMTPKAPKETRTPTDNPEKPTDDTEGLGKPRSPNTDRQQPGGFTADCEFRAASMGPHGIIYQAEQVGRKIIIIYNSDHPFYSRFILENGRNDKRMVAGVDYLIYSLATAELQQNTEDESIAELLGRFQTIMSVNLRTLLS